MGLTRPDMFTPIAKILERGMGSTWTRFPEADLQELTRAAAEIWEQEAQKSPEVKKVVDILKDFARAKGRM